jgi:PhnB protein
MNRAGFHTITPYVAVRSAHAAIEFWQRAFGAVETLRHADDQGVVRHAEVRIGDSHVMVHDVVPEFAEMRGAEDFGGSPVNFFLYVEDADGLYARALEAGATSVMAMSDQSYGRSGGVKDPFGLTWWVCTHKDVTP